MVRRYMWSKWKFGIERKVLGPAFPEADCFKGILTILLRVPDSRAEKGEAILVGISCKPRFSRREPCSREKLPDHVMLSSLMIQPERPLPLVLFQG